MTVRIAHVRHVDAPHFTVCPGSGTSVCSIGTLPVGQADELQATSLVHKSATGGEQVRLTATASGKNARSYASSGSVQVVVAPKPPARTTTPPPATTTPLPPVTLQPVPTAGTSQGAPAGMFPTISPSPSSSGSGAGGVGFPSARRQNGRARAATVAATVPLDPRQIGGQLVGLAVLAGAIAIAIARLSLRRPRPQDGPESQGPPK